LSDARGRSKSLIGDEVIPRQKVLRWIAVAVLRRSTEDNGRESGARLRDGKCLRLRTQTFGTDPKVVFKRQFDRLVCAQLQFGRGHWSAGLLSRRGRRRRLRRGRGCGGGLFGCEHDPPETGQ